MAGLMNKLKSLVGVDEDEYEYEEFEEISYDRRPYDRAKEYGLGEEVRQSNRGDNMYEQPRETVRDRYASEEPSRQSHQNQNYNQSHNYNQNQGQSRRPNVINMPGSERLKELTTRFNIVVIEPKVFDECPGLVDSLKSRKPVIVNLEKLETETARKIFDFLGGATYALNGSLQKIANNIFVFLPENVEVSTQTAGAAQEQSPWKL